RNPTPTGRQYGLGCLHKLLLLAEVRQSVRKVQELEGKCQPGRTMQTLLLGVFRQWSCLTSCAGPHRLPPSDSIGGRTSWPASQASTDGKRQADGHSMREYPAFRSVRIDPKNDVLGLPYSSGTTGQPKGVMITHYNYTAQMTISKAHFERHIMPFGGYDPKESQYTVHFLPLYHAYGFFSMNASLLFGSTVVIIRRYTPQLLLACIEKYKAARVSMVPGLLAFLAKSPMVDKYDLSSMRQVGNGGGPLSRELAEAVLKRLPHLKHVAQGYGMTEMTTGMHASVLSEGNVALGSVGKIYPNCEQKIIDPDTGKECAIGEEGELYVRGPNVMKGYWRNEKATREVLSPDGWLRTGDIVVEDERGLLYIRDRNKELIKVNAFQVAPTELEALLMTHHGVLDAAVVGIPHPSKGEVPRAYVVRRTENLTEKQIADFVADRVSHYKRLVGGVEFIREIPRNPTGKVLRRQLKEEFLKRSTNGNGRSKL
ncbi:Protein ACS-14, partial [Aphelenchoides avenae]